MSEPTHQDQAAYEAVDDALRTYPLEPPPADILPSVMRRIEGIRQIEEMRRVEARRAIPRFRPLWIDYAVSLFASGMVGLGLLLLGSFPISPHLVPDIEIQFLLLWQRIRYAHSLLWPALVGGVIFAIAAFLIAWGVFARGPSAPRITTPRRRAG